jgi:hypothetical protein
MGTPVLIGWAAGDIGAGVTAAIGAFTALYGSGRPYLNRGIELAIMAVTLAAAATLGILASPVVWAGVVTVAAVAMVAVLLCNALSVGPPGAFTITLARPESGWAPRACRRGTRAAGPRRRRNRLDGAHFGGAAAAARPGKGGRRRCRGFRGGLRRGARPA